MKLQRPADLDLHCFQKRAYNFEKKNCTLSAYLFKSSNCLKQDNAMLNAYGVEQILKITSEIWQTEHSLAALTNSNILDIKITVYTTYHRCSKNK